MLFLKKSTKLILITVAIILLLFFLHYTKLLSPVERGIVYLTKPIMSGVYRASTYVGDNYVEYKTKKDLLRENKEIKDQLTTLLKEKSLFYTEREENIFLRQQLKFVQENDFDYEIANVVGKNVDNTQNSLIIDKGENFGLKVGQPVIVNDGVLIGKINKVDKNKAFVLLINDDLSRVAVKIQNTSRTLGVIEGEFGLGIKMKLIPQTELIREDDPVVSSGLEDLVPAGLIVGQVEKIFSAPEELFQSASIRSLVDFNKVTIVNIIK